VKAVRYLYDVRAIGGFISIKSVSTGGTLSIEKYIEAMLWIEKKWMIPLPLALLVF
jgi:hypothetical protein